jgi:hypothetical protein
VRWTVTVEVGPSLATFPVEGRTVRAVQSFWGADRDGGVRAHQGIDIFAPRGTPALAAADGVVRWVGENRLGGSVVFLADPARGHSLYYAHLDRQAWPPARACAPATRSASSGTPATRAAPRRTCTSASTARRGGGRPVPVRRHPRAWRRRRGRARRGAGRAAWRAWRAGASRCAPAPTRGSAVVAELPRRTLGTVDAAADGVPSGCAPDGRSGYVAAAALEAADRPWRASAGRRTPRARAPGGGCAGHRRERRE